MKLNQMKRIEELEKICLEEPLIVLARTETGEEIETSMRDCIARDLAFVRIISGNSMADVDAYLDSLGMVDTV